MTQAPTHPTTETLHEMFGVKSDIDIDTLRMRDMITDTIRGRREGMLAIVGQCAMSGDPLVIKTEGQIISEVSKAFPDVITIHRMPPWKPRSVSTDWHGLETTEPRKALQILASQSNETHNVAIEIASAQHIERYGSLLSFGWTGGRNANNKKLMQDIARDIPGLPVGIKNGIEGDIQCAVEQIADIELTRAVDDAATILIYRGGSNAKNPAAWRHEYLRAFALTKGKLIVDAAHGAEMAHDPSGQFKKSVAGQILAMQAIIGLAAQGYKPLGIMLEASDTESPTDPHIPLAIALKGVLDLRNSQSGLLS